MLTSERARYLRYRRRGLNVWRSIKAQQCEGFHIRTLQACTNFTIISRRLKILRKTLLSVQGITLESIDAAMQQAGADMRAELDAIKAERRAFLAQQTAKKLTEAVKQGSSSQSLQRAKKLTE
jgi:hypothetical protein